MRVLTLATLKRKGACYSQLSLFRKMFGKSVEVTEALAVEHADVFDWHWAAGHLLSAPAWAEYQRVTAPALAKYERVRAPAWARLYTSEGDA